MRGPSIARWLATRLALASTFVAPAAEASFSLRYSNADVHAYSAMASCGTERFEIAFRASTTSHVALRGDAPCAITLSNSTVHVSGDAEIEIRNGKITLRSNPI